MKTLKSVQTADERAAKITGAIITGLLAVGGIYAMAYAINFFGPKLF